MIAKYTVLSNIISMVSDNILLIDLLHTLSAYNSSAIKFTDPRECLSTSWTYPEAYENFSIDPALCQMNPIKKIKLSYQIVSPYY